MVRSTFVRRDRLHVGPFPIPLIRMTCDRLFVRVASMATLSVSVRVASMSSLCYQSATEPSGWK
jgi:hypothetical protein